MGHNASAARTALKLVELESLAGSPEEIATMLENEDHIEIIKGLSFIVWIVALNMSRQDSPCPVFKAIRESTDTAAKQGHNVETNYKVLGLLDAISGHGGSFYLQAYSLKEPYSVIIGLTTLFQSLVKSALGQEIVEVTDYLYQIIDESY